MVARFAGTDNTIGNGFGVLFLFLFITFFDGGMDACKLHIMVVGVESQMLTILSN
jgi:hypothetical protein